MEEEEDVAKFKDYTPSTSCSAASSEEPSPSTPPKEETREVVKSSTAGERIFTGPLMSLLAKDENVIFIVNNKSYAAFQPT